MKKTIAVITAACLACSTFTVAALPAGDADEIIRAERGAWEALKTHDGAALAEILAPGYVSASPGGFDDLKVELRHLKEMRLESYALSGMTVREFHPGLVALTYRARTRASLGGRDIRDYELRRGLRETTRPVEVSPAQRSEGGTVTALIQPPAKRRGPHGFLIRLRAALNALGLTTALQRTPLAVHVCPACHALWRPESSLSLAPLVLRTTTRHAPL